MAAQAIVLAENLDALTPSAYFTWPGGRSVIVAQATTYPTVCRVQLKGPDGNPIDVGAATIALGEGIVEIGMNI